MTDEDEAVLRRDVGFLQGATVVLQQTVVLLLERLLATDAQAEEKLGALIVGFQTTVAAAPDLDQPVMQGFLHALRELEATARR